MWIQGFKRMIPLPTSYTNHACRKRRLNEASVTQNAGRCDLGPTDATLNCDPRAQATTHTNCIKHIVINHVYETNFHFVHHSYTFFIMLAFLCLAVRLRPLTVGNGVLVTEDQWILRVRRSNISLWPEPHLIMEDERAHLV